MEGNLVKEVLRNEAVEATTATGASEVAGLSHATGNVANFTNDYLGIAPDDMIDSTEFIGTTL